VNVRTEEWKDRNSGKIGLLEGRGYDLVSEPAWEKAGPVTGEVRGGGGPGILGCIYYGQGGTGDRGGLTYRGKEGGKYQLGNS